MVKKGCKRPPFTKEWKQHMKENHADFTGENHPMFGTHRIFTKERNEKISKAHRGILFSKDHKKKLSNIHKNLWKDKDYRNNQIKKILIGNKMSPNVSEKKLITIIKENNFPFNFVGDGSIIIGGYNPDFLSKNPKHIIEVFGDYWHNRDDIKERDKRKLDVYSSFGYKTLILWQKELNNKQKIINKINNFLNTK